MDYCFQNHLPFVDDDDGPSLICIKCPQMMKRNEFLLVKSYGFSACLKLEKKQLISTNLNGKTCSESDKTLVFFKAAIWMPNSL